MLTTSLPHAPCRIYLPLVPRHCARRPCWGRETHVEGVKHVEPLVDIDQGQLGRRCHDHCPVQCKLLRMCTCAGGWVHVCACARVRVHVCTCARVHVARGANVRVHVQLQPTRLRPAHPACSYAHRAHPAPDPEARGAGRNVRGEEGMRGTQGAHDLAEGEVDVSRARGQVDDQLRSRPARHPCPSLPHKHSRPARQHMEGRMGTADT